MFGSKSLPVRFDEVDWFITAYDGIRYLLLFGSAKYDAVYKRVRYLISQKSGITFVFSYKYAKLNMIDSYDSSKKLVIIH